MPACPFFALPPEPQHSSVPKYNQSSLRVGRATLCIVLLMALLCAFAGPAWAAPAATSTALAVSSKTVNARLITVMIATVTDPAPVQQGLVRFFDGKKLLGTAQIVNTGTRYAKGTANLSAQLAPGTHVLQAAFSATSMDAGSVSPAKQMVIEGGKTATTISATGSAGNYTLTGQVAAAGMVAPTGSVSFVDETQGNALLGSAILGSGTTTTKFAKAASYSIYNPSAYYSPYQVVVADFNGDGILDFADVEYSARISVHLGNGDGTFRPAAPFCTTGTPPTPCQAGSEPEALGVGDFNSDGIPDLVVVDGGRAGIALGNGDGTFHAPVYYNTAPASFQNVVVADLNMDGTPDLATSVNGGVSILLGNGDGTFQPHNEVGTSGWPYVLGVGDFNKDGIPDLVAGGGYNIMVLPGNGDGTFQTEVDTPIDLNPDGGGLAILDLKGTGYPSDLAVSGGGRLDVYAGKGNGAFKLSQTLYPNKGFSEAAVGIAAADLNGDGMTDLALCFYASSGDVGRVGIFTGKGDGTFNITPTVLNVGEQPLSIVTGDFDGNGALDLVVANKNDSTLSVLLNGASTLATATLANVSVPGIGTQNVLAQYLGGLSFAASQSNTIALSGNGLAAPVITALSPSTAVAGSGALTLTVTGSGFAAGAVVKWNGSARATAFVNANKLTAAILTQDTAMAGSYPVTVTSGGATSNAVNFAVVAQGGVPVLTSISPTSAVAGSPALTMTVTGSGFNSGTVVYWNGNPLGTSYVSATQLTAAIQAGSLTIPGSIVITVGNSGVMATNSLTFTVEPATHTPLAYGFFNQAGTPGASSGNIACAWSSTEYLCTITGETFYFSKYVVNVTVGSSETQASVGVNSIGGKIIVKFYNPSGTAIQTPFYITVFKP